MKILYGYIFVHLLEQILFVLTIKKAFSCLKIKVENHFYLLNPLYSSSILDW